MYIIKIVDLMIHSQFHKWIKLNIFGGVSREDYIVLNK